MTTKKRLHYFDNLKGLLILLVVFGHLLEPLLLTSEVALALYSLIYCFHMPVFAFVSGVFSKRENVGEFKELFFRLILFQIIFAVAFLLIFIIFDGTPLPNNLDVEGSQSLFRVFLMFLTPIWLLWYMLSLIWWKILLIWFKKTPKSIYIAVALALIVPFIDIAASVLSIKRTFALFPFFLIGYFLTTDTLMTWRNKKWRTFKHKFSLEIIFGLFFISLFVVFLNWTPKENSFLFFYSNFAESSLGIIRFIFALLLTYFLAICAGIGFLRLVPIKELGFSLIGKNSFNVYIFHGLVYWLLVGSGFYMFLNGLSNVLAIMILIIITYIIAKTFTLEAFNKHIQKITYENFIRGIKWKK